MKLPKDHWAHIRGLRRDVDGLKRRTRGYTTVQDTGLAVPLRDTINFVGATVADDALNAVTNITLGSSGTTVGGLCPGDIASVGPFAGGSGSGGTLTITASRGVGCDSVIVIVAAALTANSTSSNMYQITDSRGRSMSGSTYIGSEILSIAGPFPSDALEMTMGAYSLSAFGYSAGDTITLSFFNGASVTDNVAMAFAVTPPTAARGFDFGNNGHSYADTGSSSSLLWADSFGDPTIGAPNPGFTTSTFGAVVTGVASTGSGYAPAAGQFMAEFSAGGLYVAASMIPSASNGDVIEPGGSGCGGTLGVADYLFVDLA